MPLTGCSFLTSLLSSLVNFFAFPSSIFFADWLLVSSSHSSISFDSTASSSWGDLLTTTSTSCKSWLPPSSSTLSEESSDSDSSTPFAVLTGGGSLAFLSSRSFFPFLRPHRILEIIPFLSPSVSEKVLFLVGFSLPKAVVELIWESSLSLTAQSASALSKTALFAFFFFVSTIFSSFFLCFLVSFFRFSFGSFFSIFTFSFLLGARRILVSSCEVLYTSSLVAFSRIVLLTNAVVVFFPSFDSSGCNLALQLCLFLIRPILLVL